MPLREKYVDQFYKEIPELLASGQLKYTEDVSKGLESVGDGLLEVQKGANTGKKVIIVADDA